MRQTVRLICFALALVVGLAAWFACAGAQANGQQSSNTNASANANFVSGGGYNMNGQMSSNRVPDANSEGAGSHVVHTWGAAGGPDAEAETPTVSFGEPGSLWGYAAVPSVELRAGPEAGAAVVDTLELTEYDGAEILEVSGERLRVRFAENLSADGGTRARDYEGWVGWGEVVPHASAVVVDTETGEVAARLPVHPGVTSASFSPDGKRAVFYSGAGGAHGEGLPTAFEVDAETFRTLRTIETSAALGFAALLHDGDEIHALVRQYLGDGHGPDLLLRGLHVKGERVELAAGRAVTSGPGELAVAPDGRTALFIHGAQNNPAGRRVDLIDLKTLAVRNSFEVGGGAGEEHWPAEYALSRDGSEFYYRDSGQGKKIHVVNTETGQPAREITPRVPRGHWLSFWHGGVLGDWLLARVAAEEDEEGAVQHYWVRPDGKTVAADGGVENVIEAGGGRYAVNDAGTWFFKLDGDSRVRERFKIARPGSEADPAAPDDMTVLGLAASPDGRRVVIFLGVVDGC